MELEAGLRHLAATISELAAKRSALWRDASGQEFDALVLRPLAEVIDDFHRAAADFGIEIDAVLAELSDE